jgi:hypothetical protein
MTSHAAVSHLTNESLKASKIKCGQFYLTIPSNFHALSSYAKKHNVTIITIFKYKTPERTCTRFGYIQQNHIKGVADFFKQFIIWNGMTSLGGPPGIINFNVLKFTIQHLQQ